MSEQQNTERLTIGKRLRQITNEAKKYKEIQNFTMVLEDAARQEVESLRFPDLRQYLNSMIMDGTIWDWLKSEDLIATGEINSNTGEYDFTIQW